MAGTYQFTNGVLIASDPFKGLPYGMESIQKWLPVTLDEYFKDTVSGASCSRGITCTTDGLITCEFVDGSTATLPFVAGIRYPEKVFRIHTSGTTATGIFWGY
jgi:hypothetical protein